MAGSSKPAAHVVSSLADHLKGGRQVRFCGWRHCGCRNHIMQQCDMVALASVTLVVTDARARAAFDLELRGKMACVQCSVQQCNRSHCSGNRVVHCVTVDQQSERTVCTCSCTVCTCKLT